MVISSSKHPRNLRVWSKRLIWFDRAKNRSFSFFLKNGIRYVDSSRVEIKISGGERERESEGTFVFAKKNEGEREEKKEDRETMRIGAIARPVARLSHVGRVGARESVVSIGTETNDFAEDTVERRSEEDGEGVTGAWRRSGA